MYGLCEASRQAGKMHNAPREWKRRHIFLGLQCRDIRMTLFVPKCAFAFLVGGAHRHHEGLRVELPLVCSCSCLLRLAEATACDVRNVSACLPLQPLASSSRVAHWWRAVDPCMAARRWSRSNSPKASCRSRLPRTRQPVRFTRQQAPPLQGTSREETAQTHLLQP